MIKIKDYIFNENEIREIKQCKNYLRLDLTYSGPYLHIDDATFEDIEWNYGGQPSKEWLDMYRKLDDNNLELMDELDNTYKRIKELEEENKKLKEQLLNYQIPPHNQKCYKTIPVEFTCTTITDGK